MAFKYRFQHFLDIHTSTESITMLQIQAGGEYAMQRCKHLWGAFKYCKLGSISVKFLPMSTLPVDPAHLSYASDDPYEVDPRDQANPGLVRITNGEDIFTNIGDLGDTQLEQMYINTMLDPRWSKFMLQRGFSRKAVPLYWTIGQLHQNPYPDAVQNIPGVVPESPVVSETTAIYPIDSNPVSGSDGYVGAGSAGFGRYMNRSYSDPRGTFQTGHKGRLGWMPTDSYQFYANSDGTPKEVGMFQPLPAVNVITAILPKAFKTEYYYRVYISETVLFSGVKNTGIGVDSAGALTEYRAFDNFVYSFMPDPGSPAVGRPVNNRAPYTPNDGDDLP